jgi:hypothetical protein
MPFPLPRKIKTDMSPDAIALRTQTRHWRVHPVCQAIWNTNRELSRNDTFVGLIDTETWVTYLAPTFGVTPDECARSLGGKVTGGPPLRDLRERLAKFHKLPDSLSLVAASTSKQADDALRVTWREVKSVYGTGACLVAFKDDGKGFDGNSHPSLGTWVRFNIRDRPAAGWIMTALGFAIQRDLAGYFVRFASGFNQGAGSQVDRRDKSTVFADRNKPALDRLREPRDLPQEWAEELVRILARDLDMGYFPTEPQSFLPGDRTKPNAFFGKMVSRNESQVTKYKRIYNLDRLT